MEDEEWKEPLAKKTRIQGNLGKGWKKASPDKCKEAKVVQAGQSKEAQQGPKSFSDLGGSQRKISSFLVALSEAEGSPRTLKPKAGGRREKALW